MRTRLREILAELVADYASEERGMEIRQIAGGFRMATKPQHHDVVRAFAKSLKPPIRLSLAALETLAVIAYKQPVTAPEIADIRGVESASVLGTLLDRKLITTAGRKQVIGRPMQYKTSKDFLLRFGLNDVNELPSMEEFSQLASDATIEIAPPKRSSAFPLHRQKLTPEIRGHQFRRSTSESDQSEADPSAAAQASATRARKPKSRKPRSRKPRRSQKLSLAPHPKPGTPSTNSFGNRRGDGRCPRHCLRVTFLDRLMANGFSERLLLPWKQNRKDYRRF